jgi:hypothetical protein
MVAIWKKTGSLMREMPVEGMFAARLEKVGHELGLGLVVEHHAAGPVKVESFAMI